VRACDHLLLDSTVIISAGYIRFSILMVSTERDWKKSGFNLVDAGDCCVREELRTRDRIHDCAQGHPPFSSGIPQ
jgi:hypothetical protein